MYADLMEHIRSDIVKSVFAFQLQQSAPQPGAAPQTAARPAQPGTKAAQPAQAQATQPKADPAQQLKKSQLAAMESPLAKNIRTNRDSSVPQTVRKSGPQLGRNDPCWCGSGRKYKNCHMASDQQQGSGQRVAAK
jgi:preprotein translocase subunit SecA